MSDKVPVGLRARAEGGTTGRSERSVAKADAASPPPAASAPESGAGSRRSRWRFRPAAKVISNVAADSQRVKLPQMAAALSFRTIFGLIPVIVIGLVGLRAFSTEDDIRAALVWMLDYTGLSDIVVEPAESPAAVAAPGLGATPLFQSWFAAPPADIVAELAAAQGQTEPAAEAGAAANGGASTTGSTRLDFWVEELVQRASSFSIAAVGFVGLGALLYAAMAMLVEIERAFNQIFKVPLGRSWVRRITQYWSILTLGGIGLVATFWVGERFKAESEAFIVSHGPERSANIAIGVIGFFVTVSISTLILLLAYMAIPNTRVRLRPALAGAFLAAMGWETSKWCFTIYLAYSTNYQRLYGSIAIIPLFLLWVYVTWVIVLFGLRVSYLLQHGKLRETAVGPADDVVTVPVIIDPAAGVAVIAAIARAFQNGAAVQIQQLERAARVPEAVVRSILARLTDHGLVHRVQDEGRPEEFTLARPADTIAMTEVLEATYELVQSPEADPDGVTRSARPAGDATDEIVCELRRAQLQCVGSMTVAGVLGSGKAAPAGGPREPGRSPVRTAPGGSANGSGPYITPEPHPESPEPAKAGDDLASALGQERPQRE